jgi:hypothetical protein
MTNATPTLEHVLAGDAESKLQASIFSTSETVDELAKTVRSIYPAVTREGVAGAVLDALSNVVSVPIEKIFAGAWNAHRALRAYADPKQHPREEVNLVPLDEHTIRTSYKPRLDILIEGSKIKSIEFDLELELEIQAAVLKIQGGRIREIEVGSCKGKAKLSWKEGVLAEPKTREFKLPGKLQFAEGIAISGATA